MIDEKYNDGRWWGWNGGECPVHSQSIVETARRYKVGDMRARKDCGVACSYIWQGNDSGDIIAFRVIKPYREPRVWWINVYPNRVAQAHQSKDAAHRLCTSDLVECVRVVEQPE